MLKPDSQREAALFQAAAKLSDAKERAMFLDGACHGDIKSGTRVYSLPEEDGTVYWLAWSADSRRLAVSRDNGKIAIWDLETVGQILTKLGLNP